MPLYEYICRNKECKDVGKLQALASAIDKRDKQKCDECKRKLERQVSRTSFRIAK